MKKTGGQKSRDTFLFLKGLLYSTSMHTVQYVENECFEKAPKNNFKPLLNLPQPHMVGLKLQIFSPGAHCRGLFFPRHTVLYYMMV